MGRDAYRLTGRVGRTIKAVLDLLDAKDADIASLREQLRVVKLPDINDFALRLALKDQHRRTCEAINDHFDGRPLNHMLLRQYIATLPRPEGK
jgi:hypothetical protein